MWCYALYLIIWTARENEAFASQIWSTRKRALSRGLKGFYEAKHTRVSPCAEGTLHERCSLHFSYTEGVLHCRASQFSRDKNKNPPRKVGFELCHRHNVFISSWTVRTAAKPQKLSGGEFLVRMTEPGSVNRCSRRDNQKTKALFAQSFWKKFFDYLLEFSRKRLCP